MVIIGRLWVAFIIILYVGDMFASLACVLKLWDVNKEDGPKLRFIRYLGMLMSGILVDGVCELIASLDRPTGVHVSTFYTAWFWTGRACRSFTLWSITVFMLKRNRYKAKVIEKTETQPPSDYEGHMDYDEDDPFQH